MTKDNGHILDRHLRFLSRMLFLSGVFLILSALIQYNSLPKEDIWTYVSFSLALGIMGGYFNWLSKRKFIKEVGFTSKDALRGVKFLFLAAILMVLMLCTAAFIFVVFYSPSGIIVKIVTGGGLIAILYFLNLLRLNWQAFLVDRQKK